MPQTIQLGRNAAAGNSPSIQEWSYSGGSWVTGAVMIINTGLAQEAGATPTTNILGIALQPVDTNLGFQAANSPLQVTGRKSTTSILMANGGRTIYRGSLVNASPTIVVPTVANVGVAYGLSKQGGVWCVDTSLTGASSAVVVIAFNTTTPDGGFVFFQFKSAALALP